MKSVGRFPADGPIGTIPFLVKKFHFNMKIVVLTPLPPSFGGSQILAKGLIVSLERLGVEIAVVAQHTYEVELLEGMENRRYPYRPEQHQEILDRGIRVYPLVHRDLTSKTLEKRSHEADRDFMDKLKEVLEKEDPDLIHSHWNIGRIREITEVAAALNIPLVVSVHGMTSLIPLFDSYMLAGMTSEEVLSLLNGNAHTIVVSGEIFDYCRGKGIRDLSHIYAGIDLDFFHNDSGASRRDILYVGKNNRHKGLREMCEGFLEVAQEMNDNLYLVGRGTIPEVFAQCGFFLEPSKRERFGKLIEQGRVILLGEIWPEKVRELYRRVRVLVLPSLTEGLPLAILEALACGTPVIASDVGSVSDVLQDGQNGFLLPKGDSRAVARALLNLEDLEGPRLSENCRASVASFSIDRSAREHLELFEKIIARHSHPPGLS